MVEVKGGVPIPWSGRIPWLKRTSISREARSWSTRFPEWMMIGSGGIEVCLAGESLRVGFSLSNA